MTGSRFRYRPIPRLANETDVCQDEKVSLTEGESLLRGWAPLSTQANIVCTFAAERERDGPRVTGRWCLRDLPAHLGSDAQEGRNHYVWQEVKMGLWQPRSQLHEMNEEEGRKAAHAGNPRGALLGELPQGGPGLRLGGLLLGRETKEERGRAFEGFDTSLFFKDRG